MFIILSGSSGAGKNTIINKIKNENKSYKFLTTYTTREKREGEVNGEIYNFVTKDEFQRKIKNNEMIEHEIIHGNYMGMAWKEFNVAINDNKILIKDIGVQGTFNIKDKLADKIKVIAIFLYVKKRELIKRLKQRGENDIKLRMKRFKYENSFKYKYDFLINNANIDLTVEYIKNIVKTQNEYHNILPLMSIEKIKDKKVGKYIEKIKTGKRIKPVKVYVSNGNLYLKNGLERYVACAKLNHPICKILINKNNVSFKENLEKWKQMLV